MKNPKLISKPFAQNGQKNVIPEKYETSMESNQATWDQGFGQITMLPVSAGGLPPKGQDFNGILNQMCETIVHISKGGVFKFSVDYATAINGYPKGAILQSEDERKYYQSLIDNNKVNFNTASQDQIKTSWKLVMTDDLLDQLSKKLESSAVVQSTGVSTTSVMSQNAVTKAFQPVGNYADKSSSGSQRFNAQLISNDGIFVMDGENTGTYFGLLAVAQGKPFGLYCSYSGVGYTINLPEKKNGTMALVGDSYTKSESDGKYQAKGSYQASGYSYSKSETDTKYQPKGNYADKSATNVQEFSAGVTIKNELYINNANNTVGISLNILQDEPKIISLHKTASWKTINIPEKSGTMALISDIEEANNIPVGSPIPWSLSTAPSGYLICQGQTFNKTTYPKLATAYPSGNLPDMRGDVIRGLDAGRSIDVGRQILSEQIGNSLLSSPIMNNPEEKGFELKINNIGTTGGDNQGWNNLYQQIEGVNGNETRMRNIAFLYIVRAA